MGRWRQASPPWRRAAAARRSTRLRARGAAARVRAGEAENLLVGLAPSDDAAVYKLDDERALVFTLDFFPPLVDDPALYGRIAATNALNDVFAMGGSPLLALSIAAFPESLPNETLAAIFGAADEQVRAAGAILAGGHTLPRRGAEVRARGRGHGPPGTASGRRAAPGRATPSS